MGMRLLACRATHPTSIPCHVIEPETVRRKPGGLLGEWRIQLLDVPGLAPRSRRLGPVHHPDIDAPTPAGAIRAEIELAFVRRGDGSGIDPDRRRIGLSLKRVASSDYLDADWQDGYDQAPTYNEEDAAIDEEE